MKSDSIRTVSMFDAGEKLKIQKPIRLIELFGGIGSQAKALERLGANFEHYRLCEFDKYAVRSYNAVHGTNFETSDVTKIHGSDLGIVDTDRYTYILTYSFPCTDLSSAGTQAGMKRGSGTRSGLLWEVERLLIETENLPQILLMENVPEVVSDKFIADFSEWVQFLNGKGYTSKYTVLNATGFGVPQNRARCFMVSWLGEYYYDFPEEKPCNVSLKDILQGGVDERYFLSENRTRNLILTICENKQSKFAGGGNIIRAGSLNPKKEIQDRCLIFSTDGISVTCRATDYKNPIKIVVGEAAGLYLNVTPPFQRGPEENRILDETGGKLRVRYLTPLECWRLMGFDDQDFFNAQSAGVSNSQLYKQAGNSIVVNVLEAIFKEML